MKCTASDPGCFKLRFCDRCGRLAATRSSVRWKWGFALVCLLTVGPIIPVSAEGLPTKVDLKPEFDRFGMTIHRQGDRDTCSLFAVTAVCEFEFHRKDPNHAFRFSEEYLIWAANAGTGLEGDQAMFYEAVHGLNVLGICQEELMPFQNKRDPFRKPTQEAIADAKNRSERWEVEWIKRWDIQRPLDDFQLIQIRKALAANHPVACGFRWPKALKGAALLKVPKTPDVFDGHSVALTGYEEDSKQEGGGIFHFRNSWGPEWGHEGYGTMSFAYAKAYANDAVWLKLGPAHSEIPAQRIEAESMSILSRSHCWSNPQRMDKWGRLMWSNDQQLFCESKKGGRIDLAFRAKKAGRYHVRLLATAAPDYGIIRVALDGKIEGSEVDLYSGRVCPWGAIDLGVHDLTPFDHRLRVTSIGKAEPSGNYFFGLDALELIPAK